VRIGIIGAGHIGGTLAARLVAAGHELAISNSRGPETLAGLVEGAQPMTVEDVERFGEVVVVSIPLGRHREVPTDAVEGKVVIDTNNYYPQRDGHIPACSRIVRWRSRSSGQPKTDGRDYSTRPATLRATNESPQGSALLPLCLEI
jgi:predicted dinucleotide-binding enzyme